MEYSRLRDLLDRVDKKADRSRQRLVLNELLVALKAAARDVETALKRADDADGRRARRSPQLSSTTRHVAGSFTLDALLVPRDLEYAADITAAVRGDKLFFIEPWQHFAFRVGGVVFHTAPGAVVRGAAPTKVLSCFKSTCESAEKCKYYHDPELYGEPDARNFVAADVGGLSAIADEIRACSAERARMLVDYAAFCVLVALLAHKHVLARRGERWA